jgi:spermidine synthase
MVVKTAKEYFSFKPDKDSVFTLDGRYFLRSTNKRYDIIILDAFSGDSPPSHMVSIEAFELMKKRLSRDGVLLINFLGSNEKENTFVLSSLNKTLKEVFNFVDVYVSEEYYHQATRLINFTFVAYFEDTKIERSLSIRPPVQARFVKDLEGLLDRRISLSGDAIILTDDYNPIDFYDMRMREWLRAESIKTIDKTIAVH